MSAASNLTLLVPLLCCGCASVGVMQSAQTLGKKHWELALEGTAQAQANSDSISLYPLGGVAFRYGVAEAVDIGARLGPLGLELNGKFMFTKRESKVIVSLAPGLGGTFAVPSGILMGTFQFTLPLLIGINLSKRLELVIAPRLHDTLAGISAGQAGGLVNTFYAGAALGLVVRVWRFKLIPDVGFLAPLATTTWRSDLPPGTAWAHGRWVLQANFTVTFGSAR